MRGGFLDKRNECSPLYRTRALNLGLGSLRPFYLPPPITKKITVSLFRRGLLAVLLLLYTIKMCTLYAYFRRPRVTTLSSFDYRVVCSSTVLRSSALTPFICCRSPCAFEGLHVSGFYLQIVNFSNEKNSFISLIKRRRFKEY